MIDVNAAYDKKPAIWNVSLKIPSGEMIGVVGPNGAGKSTFIKTIVGLIQPISGSVMIDGKPFKKTDRKVAYVGQRNEVDWEFPITVYEVASMGLVSKWGLFGRPKKSDHEKILQVLDQLGLKELVDRQIGELSGGQQRRLFVARALLQEADIYLLDEPFAGIDLTTEKLLVQLFTDLAKEGKMVVVVHHDLTQIKRYFSYLIMLNIHLIAHGPTETVFHYDNFSKTFGDQAMILEEALKLTELKKKGD